MVISEWNWSDWTGLAVAAIVPTLAYDIVGLAAAVLRGAKEDPRGWITLIKELFPWGRK